jgi:tetratricopeptide (TPR) repeat protein
MAMSAKKVEELEAAGEEVCACCGIAAVDDITLKFCDDCDLVIYCGDGCQENHRDQHEDECKKRRAELHGKHLFDQPDSSHLGECPICCLPLSLDESKSILNTCCSKPICQGCDYANKKREIEQGQGERCAYCREPLSESDEEIEKRTMERVKKNDPVALSYMGTKHSNEGDYARAAEYYTTAAELGDVNAQFLLGALYFKGQGVEKDMKKAMYHFEQAAIGGHPGGRTGLAIHEEDNGRMERAVKHVMIAANLGHDASLNVIKDYFMKGIVSKEEYAAALRGYQAAVNETKSAEREKGEAFHASLE